MASLTCLPDRYLLESHLHTLFHDFNTSLTAGQSTATIFSSLVNNVRQVYMSALLETKEVLYAAQTQELAALKREREEERLSPPKYVSDKPASSVLPDSPGRVATAIVPAMQAPLEINEEPSEEINWPANTFPIHVGSVCQDYRCDMPDWRPMNRDGWTERVDFKVFKFQEPSTIKIYVVQSTRGTHRVMVNREPWPLEGWTKYLEFHAYGRQRAGTQLIWVAYRGDPDRCIFVKGGRGETMEGWERRLEFWVPV